jgi:uncharacterized membrane protein
MGALCGAAFSVPDSVSIGVCCLAGGLGGLIGAFAGYTARHCATAEGRLSDMPVALVEDVIAIGGGLFLVSRF